MTQPLDIRDAKILKLKKEVKFLNTLVEELTETINDMINIKYTDEVKTEFETVKQAMVDNEND